MTTPTDELPWPTAGSLVLGRYELLGVIGQGGMGTVSRARDVTSGRLVAIKRVRSADARGEREAMASARLHHPAIARLIDAEPSADGWIIVSELVEGADLRAVLRAGELAELDIARFAGSIVRALAHAHREGVIHRDIKPANILCPADPRRAGAWAKLTDFGVAALAGAETLTAVGDVVGTMAYMAPEQARGDKAGAPADVFALAVVVYEALAGANPRRGSTAAETAARALSSLPPLARVRPDLPSAVHAAIDHCLELEPGHRGGLAELDEGLRRLAALTPAPVPVAPEPEMTVVDRRGRRPAEPLVPYVAPPGHTPVGDPAERLATPADLGPHGWAGDAGRPDGPPVAPWPEAAPVPAPLASRGRLPRVPLRLLGTAGAAAAIWSLTDAAAAPPALAALGLAAFLVPRLTWAGICLTAAGLLFSRDDTAAWLAAVAAIAPVALVAGRNLLWPAAGLAAGLTTVGAPGAWPALAALAPSAALRVGLALHGALVASVVATATRVPFLNVPGGDFTVVVPNFVAPLAGIYAVAAVLLGVIVRGRTFGADLAAGIAWAGALGYGLVAAGLASAEPLLWAGPAAAAAAVVLARASARGRELAFAPAPQPLG